MSTNYQKIKTVTSLVIVTKDFELKTRHSFALRNCWF